MPKTTLLVISNDSQFTYLIKSYMHPCDWNTQIGFPYGLDLLHEIQQTKPAALLFDADRSSVRDIDALRSIQLNGATCDIPVLICAWDEDMVRSLGVAYEHFLRKPVNYNDFWQALSNNTKETIDA